MGKRTGSGNPLNINRANAGGGGGGIGGKGGKAALTHRTASSDSAGKSSSRSRSTKSGAERGASEAGGWGGAGNPSGAGSRRAGVDTDKTLRARTTGSTGPARPRATRKGTRSGGVPGRGPHKERTRQSR